MARREIKAIPDSELLQKPWLVAELPYFHDGWERYMKKQPSNLGLVHHIGSRAYFETFQYSEDRQKMHRLEELTKFAPFRVQPDDDEFAEALARVKGLCIANPAERYLHIRHDLEGAVEETWRNAPFRDIVGHSLHKIPQSQLDAEYMEVEGKWWHIRDYYEAQALSDGHTAVAK
jgi:hypothetical protein